MAFKCQEKVVALICVCVCVCVHTREKEKDLVILMIKTKQIISMMPEFAKCYNLEGGEEK